MSTAMANCHNNATSSIRPLQKKIAWLFDIEFKFLWAEMDGIMDDDWCVWSMGPILNQSPFLTSPEQIVNSILAASHNKLNSALGEISLELFSIRDFKSSNLN